MHIGITDAHLKNGVFHPSGHDSIWLFVTKNKQNDRTPYYDNLEGDVLAMTGQTLGRTDNLLITHVADNREVILFYRESKHSHHDYGFRFEGMFIYADHIGSQPSQFIYNLRLKCPSVANGASRSRAPFVHRKLYRRSSRGTSFRAMFEPLYPVTALMCGAGGARQAPCADGLLLPSAPPWPGRAGSPPGLPDS